MKKTPTTNKSANRYKAIANMFGESVALADQYHRQLSKNVRATFRRDDRKQ